MPTVENWQIGREMDFPYEEARPERQWAAVFDLNKCIECQTCTLACKTTWTHEEGQEHMFWNNVETKPYGSHPVGWDQRMLEEMGTMEWDGETYEGDTMFETEDVDWDDPDNHPTEGGVDEDTAGFMPSTDDWRYPNLGEDETHGEEISTTTHFDDDTHPVWFHYLPRICNHCTYAGCAGGCPVQAIYKREEDGVVLIDEDACEARLVCNESCPYKKAQFNPSENISQKCIGCYPKTEDGRAPQCFENCLGKIRLHGYINEPDEADSSNPIDFLVHEKELALPLYPQFGLEPNVYYIPPINAPTDYLTQLFGPGVEDAVETYEAMRNGEEPEIQGLLHLIGSTEWSLTEFEIDGDEAVGYYEGDEVGRVPITEPTAERDRYDEDEDVYRLDIT
ncbi:4Fe-4S dicluster domain-containing protein [Halobiforma nitratireducens]|uniref:Anaerobic dehydrogenase iron-sulfur binding subunit 1 n=1 Tax=Halobiforma nitratireducens JCM 10879 TaxID=1227454 RepID=M0MJX4_9EURY|nr:4Fe-4S dicluster domain-containing protein [Halobiforma nitratireducens]EMA45966.1 anaerobic dehydrogenase iron-sulfur binding subunit 1 [Halobiforma nitratireducens JCM 10879]